eukprot:g3584.t1
MAEIRRRKREESRARRKARKKERLQKQSRRAAKSLPIFDPEDSDYEDIELDRFPVFPMKLNRPRSRSTQKSPGDRRPGTSPVATVETTPKGNKSLVKRYSPGWKPKIKCPVHYRHRLQQQGYIVEPKYVESILGRKKSVLEEDASGDIGDLEMEMALFKSKKDEGLFNKRDMLKPPDKWVHYPRYRTDFLPVAREMASFTPTPSRGIFMFGGIASKRTNEMANLDPRTLNWRKVVSKGGIPPSPRSGHSALCVQGKHSIYYYGGEEGSNLSDVSVNSPKNLPRNKKIPYHKRKSNKRESYIREIPKNVLAGVSSNPPSDPHDRKLIEDDIMYAFDYRHEKWTTLAPSPNPGPRYAASLTMLKQRNKALLFGGVSQIIIKEEVKGPDAPVDDGHIHARKTIKKKKRIYMDDIWILDTHEISFSGPMPTVGHRPSARAGHCAVCLNTSSLLLFGGMSQKQDHHEIYELKLTVRPMRWVCIHTHGTFPGPRISATAFLSPFDLSSIYVFGGTINNQHNANANDVLLYDHGTYRWKKLECEGHVPEERYWHMGCIAKGQDGDVKIGDGKDDDGEEAKSPAAPERKQDRFSMYIVGGTGDTGFVPFDVYALHILPAPYQENTKGNMYSKLSFKWDSARHGMLRKPFKTWKAFVRNNKRKRAIEQQ